MSESHGSLKGLRDKVALVTGAASGIGRGTVERLLREGARIVATDLRSPDGFGAAEILGLPHDVTDEDQWRSVVESTRDRCGRLDVLVNNAGIGLTARVVDTKLADWQQLLRVNVDGVFLGVKHALPLMRESGGGSIVNVSSTAGIQGSAGASAYCASKGAVRLFTKAVALECAAENDGVRVNSVHPGPIETAIWDSLFHLDPGSDPERRHAMLENFATRTIPLGRPGLVEEVAAAIAWLASDESSFVTGAELVIDGGKTLG